MQLERNNVEKSWAHCLLFEIILTSLAELVTSCTQPFSTAVIIDYNYCSHAHVLH